MSTGKTAPTNVSQIQPGAHQLWPEPLRDVPAKDDPFPSGLALRWLLPGLIGMLILLGVYWYLEQRAGKQVAFVNAGGALGVVRADGAGARVLRTEGVRFSDPPQWSPDGRIFAVTPLTGSEADIMLIEPSGRVPVSVVMSDANNVTIPGDAWSHDGALLVTTTASPPAVQLIDVAQAQGRSLDLRIDTEAPVRWNPTRRELLVTARSNDDLPELRLIKSDGQHQVFAPEDKQSARLFGTWSPDGGQVAYIADAQAIDQAGALWVANADGSNAHQLVGDGRNSAPVWSPRGDAIFFTRIITGTTGSVSYDLYRVRSDGQDVARIGASVQPLRFAQQDSRTLIDWSPDGQYMFFQSMGEGQITISLARPDGSSAQVLEAAPPNTYLARWSPTSRALLLAGSNSFLYWLDSKRVQSFPEGVGYAWQP